MKTGLIPFVAWMLALPVMAQTAPNTGANGDDFNPDTCINLQWNEDDDPQCLDARVVSQTTITVTLGAKTWDYETEKRRILASDDPMHKMVAPYLRLKP